MDKKKAEEILESILRRSGAGDVSAEDLVRTKEHEITHEMLQEMSRDGLIKTESGKIKLTGSGKETATRIIRCHRLAERLFEVLDFKDANREEAACDFEHVLPQEAAEAICTLLGHPKECPHGYEIPPGDCCRRAESEVRSIVANLSELKPGEKGKIVYMTTKRHGRLDMLSTFGFFPGVEVKVHQVFPSFVVQVKETQIAVDAEVIKDIFVRRV